MMTTQWQQVHLRINDAATGKPTPCRVHCTDAVGKQYLPYGHFLPEFQFREAWTSTCEGQLCIFDEHWAYTEGTCEIQLPVGVVTIEAAKGIEYKPLKQ